MLVLSRRVSESLLIGPDVRITVLKVERSHVRIGIEAPGSVTVLRAELVEEPGKERGLSYWGGKGASAAAAD
jgi:carbon storage regulator